MGVCFLVPLAGLGDVSENTSCFNVETSFNAENHYITRRLRYFCRFLSYDKKKQTKRFVSFFGAAGRTRTGMLSPTADFESATSANFVTAAKNY